MNLRRCEIVALIAALIISALPCSALAAKSHYKMPYYIEVDLTNQIVTIYNTSDDSVAYQMLCSTGLKDSTPRGTFYLPPAEKGEREKWFYFTVFSCYAQYATRIYKGVLFHSLPCNYKSQGSVSQKAVRDLGRPASHGCIRLRWQDAQFIAENCLEGTRVHIDKSRKPNKDLRQLLYEQSFDYRNGLNYNQYLGRPEGEGELGLFSTGSEVTDLQYRLRDLGIFNGEINGEYHGDTVNAVRTAQRLMGVDATGIADLEFQQRLFSDEAPVAQDVPISEGISGPVVRILQQQLTDLGLYTGPIDSVYDVEVCESLKLFQGAYGYPMDGVASSEIQKAINYEANKLHALFDGLGGYSTEMTQEPIRLGMVSTESGIRLRTQDNYKSDVMGHLDNGTIVTVLQEGSQWVRVQHGLEVGFANDDYLKCFDHTNVVLKYTTPDGNASYFIGHSNADYTRGAFFPSELFAERLAADLPMDSYDDVMIEAAVNTGADDSPLNLRDQPSAEGQVIEKVPNGAQLTAMLVGDTWSLAEYEGVQGYVMSQFLTIQKPEDEEDDAEESVDRVNSTLVAMVRCRNSRHAPVYDIDSDDASVLGEIKNGAMVTILETRDSWSHISYNDHEGYMRDEDLQFVTDAKT